MPGEGVVGPRHLDVAAWRPGPVPQLAGSFGRDPAVLGAVHDQQRPRRDGRHRVQRVQPRRGLVPLRGELSGRGREEPGELLLDLVRAQRQRAAQARRRPVHRDRAHPRLGGGGDDGRPAAQAVPHHRDPAGVHPRDAGQVAGRRGHVAGDGAQVVPARAAPAAAVVEQQRVPAAVPQRDREVEVLLQAGAAVQEQRGGLGLVPAGQVQSADEAVPVAVEGDAGDALVFGVPLSSPHCPGP